MRIAKKKFYDKRINYFSGDIILTPDQAESIYASAAAETGRRVKRKFIGSKVRRWDPRRPIFFSFDGSHSLLIELKLKFIKKHFFSIA